jgi:hypothetical protein
MIAWIEVDMETSIAQRLSENDTADFAENEKATDEYETQSDSQHKCGDSNKRGIKTNHNAKK